MGLIMKHYWEKDEEGQKEQKGLPFGFLCFLRKKTFGGFSITVMTYLPSILITRVENIRKRNLCFIFYLVRI